MNDPLDQLRLRFAGLRPVSETTYGQVYAGQDFTGADVTVAVLSESAAADPTVRNGFADAVWRHSPGAVPDQVAVHAADLHAARPWAAIRNPVGQPGAEQLLAGLSGVAAAPGAPPLDAPPVPAPPRSPAYPPAAAPGSPAYPSVLPAYPPPPPAYPPASAPGSPAYPPGYPPPPPGYPPSPPGGGGHPGAPARSGSPWPWLIGVAASVLALVVVVAVAVVAVRMLGQDDDPTIRPPQPPAASPPAGQPPTPPAPPGSSGTPELRDVEPVSLIGPTWGDDEDTYTMAFDGWPFAFRTPPTWGCIGSSYPSIPESVAWHCINEGDPDNGQQVNVMLWECATSCTEAEQGEMIEAWLDDPQDAVRLDDPPVAYVEYEPNHQGNYAIDLSHFGGAGGELRWHIGVYAESPSETRDDVLKILNDILSQSA